VRVKALGCGGEGFRVWGLKGLGCEGRGLGLMDYG
jgi:hypothetical protein